MEKERLGFGVGLVNCAQNIGSAVAPLTVGVILDAYKPDQVQGFTGVNYFMAFISLTFFLILLVWSTQVWVKSRKKLNKFDPYQNYAAQKGFGNPKIRPGSETLL